MPQPFDIEKAKAGVPVITRNGIKVKIHSFDLLGSQPILFQYKNDPNIYRCTITGVYNYDEIPGSIHDLMHPDEEMYVNVYKHDCHVGAFELGHLRTSLTEAGKNSKDMLDTGAKFLGTYKLVKV